MGKLLKGSLLFFLLCNLLSPLSADTVTVLKSKETIQDVKTYPDPEGKGLIVEYEDGTRRGFKPGTISVENRSVSWDKIDKDSGKRDWVSIGVMGTMAFLWLVLP